MISPDELIRLWSAHATALELLARARCAEPEDCVQVAFIRLACEKTTPDDPLAWLARVVRNLAIDQSRSEVRRRQREREFAHTYTEAFEPPATMDDALRPEELAKAMETLDVAAREIVTAHIWNGMTFRQISEAFAISSSSAHRQYTAALTHMRNVLKAAERLS